MIDIKNVHKFFNKGRQNEIHVINDVTLSLPDKGMIAVFGKSGCGKTTLLNVIGGLDGFSSGTVSVEGQNIKKDTDIIRNKYIGYIFQNYNLNNEISCFDNVADALRLCGVTDKDQIEQRVTAALANVDMEKYKKRTPDTLSGGQQQRIAIARAIVKNPKIILADEPTGNLDETNTVMIMDMLKVISRDHLVLIVTHEADLVDYYCDSVIQLADGKIVDVKNNEGANGLNAKDKNAIYLGEFDKKESQTENAKIEYYGENTENPINIRIINNGGKIYLKVDNSDVHILDNNAEIKLYDGVYEEKKEKGLCTANVDMSSLPPIEGNNFGKLFSFKYSVKSGYASNFKTKKKKGAKLLRNCMCLFAVALVFISSVFGVAIGNLSKIRDSYNHNVCYVYTPTDEISQKINDALKKGEHGIDFVTLKYDVPRGDESIRFNNLSFETFDNETDSFKVNAVYLDSKIAEGFDTVSGKNKDLEETDMIITTKLADDILKQSTFSYISKYDDLIGLFSRKKINEKSLRIAGIVKSDESAVYLDSLSLATMINQPMGYNFDLAANYEIEAQKGSAVLVINAEPSDALPKKGETIKIGGKDINISKIIYTYANYEEWLKENKINKLSIEEYFASLLNEEQQKDETGEYFNKIFDTRYFEYYDYLYSEFDSYLQERYRFQKDIYSWLYIDRGIEGGKFSILGDYRYYAAIKYKEKNGKYPSLSEYDMSEKLLQSERDLLESLETLRKLYEEEYYNSNLKYSENNQIWFEYKYLLNSDDYIDLSKQTGKTHKSVAPMWIEYEKKAVEIYDESADFVVVGDSSIVFTVIHSTDVDQTEKWLLSEFSDTEIPEYYDFQAIITPDVIFDASVKDSVAQITAGVISMLVVLVIMCVCMYFIMRSSLMNRIKEVGVYRAIGVSKNNLKFRFFIESLVLSTLTVFLGYLASSAFIGICISKSSMFSTIFFYPWWYALIILVILYAVCIICGSLPIVMLLRKTPSEILAKYDI